MLISETVEIQLSSGNIKHYESLGYFIPRIKDDHYRWTVLKGTKIKVKVLDLPRGSSSAIVKVKCDYCGKKIDKTYSKYCNSHEINDKDSCDDCKVLKSDESVFIKYGLNHNSQIDTVRENINNASRTDEKLVIDIFKEKELTIVETNFHYKNFVSPIEFICNKHPEEGVQTTTYINLVDGGMGCKKCRYDKISKENSYMWKGGISDLSHYLRKKTSKWQTESLKYYKYTCQLTGLRYKSIIIHHIYPFIKILNETLKILNMPLYDEIIKYSEEDLIKIEEKFLELHFKYGLGIPLKSDIHKLFHKIYSNKNNTYEQFVEFQQRYSNGEFDTQLKEELKSYNSIIKLSTHKEVV